MNKTLSLICVICLCLLSFNCPAPISATEPNFTSFSWEQNANNATIEQDDFKIKLVQQNVTNKFPYIRSIDPINLFDSNEFRIDIKYDSLGNFGTGIVINKNLPGINGIVANMNDDALFAIWNDGPSGLGLYSWICPDEMSSCAIPYKLIDLGLNNISLNKFSFHKRNDKFTFVVNNVEIDKHITSEIEPKYIWIGNPEITRTADTWSSFTITQLIKEVSNKTPIVIVPGMGASVDYQALLTGGEGDNWHVPSYVTIFDNLITNLESTGYEKDKNLFVFAYDWRKSIKTNADKLAAYLVGKGINSENKTYLVGHSMGGLVSKVYTSTYGSNSLNKLVIIGSPHEGSVDAYPLWQAGQVFEDIWWAKAILSITSLADRKAIERPIETLRRNIPSVQEILPTHNYLKKNNIEIDQASMTHQNTLLPQYNDTSQFDNMAQAIYGTGQTTKRWIKVQNPPKIDRMWGIWDDGKPLVSNSIETSDGDGTVLITSAKGSFANTMNLSLSHNALMYDRVGIEKIFETLNIPLSEVASATSMSSGNEFLSVSLHSPGEIKICDMTNKCDNEIGVLAPDKKWAMLPEPQSKYTINVSTTGSEGAYYVAFDTGNNLLDQMWVPGFISQNRIDSYTVSIDDNKLKVSPSDSTLDNSVTYLWNEARKLDNRFDKKSSVIKLLSATGADRLRQAHLSRLELIDLILRGRHSNTDRLVEIGFEIWKLLDMDDHTYWQNDTTPKGKYNFNTMLNVRNSFVELIIRLQKDSNNVDLAKVITNAKNLLSDLDSLPLNQNVGLHKAKMASCDQWLLLALRLKPFAK